ncbi:MAG: BON domain-containing protein [Gemmatimonadetes bacterium]|nr:BON domain-containing protein [Gemmatimonadota bacterium]
MHRTLSRKVTEALREDERLCGEMIRASATGGFVFLRGAVTTYTRKLAAEQLAASIPGVQGVVNALVVEPEQITPDRKVAEYVRTALEAHADLRKETITVSVRNGEVTLNGNVLREEERSTAERVSLRLRGVRSVRNLIIVDRAAETTDQAIAHSIRRRLFRRHDLGKLSIQVSVNNDTVVLSGQVPDTTCREAAEEIARQSPVLHVRNEIEVTKR